MNFEGSDDDVGGYVNDLDNSDNKDELWKFQQKIHKKAKYSKEKILALNSDSDSDQ